MFRPPFNNVANCRDYKTNWEGKNMSVTVSSTCNENLVILKRVFMLINFFEYIAKTERAIHN